MSAKYPSECPMCQGEGLLRWRQPFPDGVLRELEHPCPNGCGPGWRLPAAEREQVVEAESGPGPEPESGRGPDSDPAAVGEVADRPARRPGRADQANELGGGFVATALETWGFKD